MKTNGLAIASMILSFVGIFMTLCCLPIGLILLVPSLVLGCVALSQINKNNDMQGKGMAITGIVVSCVGFAILPLMFLLAMMVSSF